MKRGNAPPISATPVQKDEADLCTMFLRLFPLLLTVQYCRLMVLKFAIMHDLPFGTVHAILTNDLG